MIARVSATSHFDPGYPRGGHTSRRVAFTLVEVALSLGVFSFAIVALLGMMPIGLNTMRDSATSTVSTHIMRGVAAEARQSDFSALSGDNGPDLRWFDNEGFAADLDTERQAFSVRVSVTDPGTVSNPTSEALVLPGLAGEVSVANSKVKRVTVEVFRGAPAAGELNRVASGVFLVGDNGR